ncbi:MAG: hypothetical protein Q8900_12355 [Bacillota bacterium]|nr:hypothetical protein [Bacillota bacterium]
MNNKELVEKINNELVECVELVSYWRNQLKLAKSDLEKEYFEDSIYSLNRTIARNHELLERLNELEVPATEATEATVSVVKKIKARIIEMVDLSQMFNIRKDFNSGSRKGKMHWEDIELQEVLNNLDNQNVMIFTKKFGEVDESDRSKLENL